MFTQAVKTGSVKLLLGAVILALSGVVYTLARHIVKYTVPRHIYDRLADCSEDLLEKVKQNQEEIRTILKHSPHNEQQ